MRAAVNAWIGDVPQLADLFAGAVDPDARQTPIRPGATRRLRVPLAVAA